MSQATSAVRLSWGLTVGWKREPPPPGPTMRQPSARGPGAAQAKTAAITSDRRLMARGRLFGRDDFQQLDFEDERRSARNCGRVPRVAVGDVGGAGQARFAAHFHALHTFGPALDDAVERELRGLIALVGTVELGAVDRGAAVVDFHRVGDFRRFAGAYGDFGVHESGGGFDGA